MGRAGEPDGAPESKRPASPLDAALRLLAFRQHSSAELRLKLARRGYSAEECEQTLTRLVELGYLDDRAFARSLLARREGSRGRQAIAAELAQRGIDRHTAAGVLEELDPAREVEAAARLAQRLAGGAYLDEAELRRRIGSKLVRRGFSYAIAAAACARLAAGTTLDQVS